MGNLVNNARIVYDAVNRMSRYHPHSSALPAQAARLVLRYLHVAANQLPGIMELVATGIHRSPLEYDVEERGRKDPEKSIRATTAHLDRCQELGQELAQELLEAMESLSGQRAHPKPREKEPPRSSAAFKFFTTHGGQAMSANDRVTYELLRASGFRSQPEPREFPPNEDQGKIP